MSSYLINHGSLQTTLVLLFKPDSWALCHHDSSTRLPSPQPDTRARPYISNAHSSSAGTGSKARHNLLNTTTTTTTTTTWQFKAANRMWRWNQIGFLRGNHPTTERGSVRGWLGRSALQKPWRRSPGARCHLNSVDTCREISRGRQICLLSATES